MDMNLQKFQNLIDVAQAYKSMNMQIYLFLKDVAFRIIFDTFSRQPYNENTKGQINQKYNQFQYEIQQYNWNFYNMKKDTYSSFLEFFYNQINFDSADVKTLTICKDLTEVNSFFGVIDDLAQKRIDYFNNKIAAKSGYTNMNPQMGKSLNQQQYNQPMNQQMGYSMNQQQKGQQSMMQQQRANPQSNKYNPPAYNSGTVPRLVDQSFRLPMSKSDSQYLKLRAKIAEEIEYANLELDYHKVDMARARLEAVAYYLHNIYE